MHALYSLMREHKDCLQLVDALESYADDVSRGTPVAMDDLAHFARLFRDLTDHVHHEKEEEILLPCLVRHGFDWDNGPLAEIRRQHEHERYLSDVLQHAAAKGPGWLEEHRQHVIDASRALVDFQRKHIEMETTQLFPAVLARLNPSELDALGRQLADFDSIARATLDCAELEQLSQRLVARYGADVAHASCPATSHLGLT